MYSANEPAAGVKTLWPTWRAGSEVEVVETEGREMIVPTASWPTV